MRIHSSIRTHTNNLGCAVVQRTRGEQKKKKTLHDFILLLHIIYKIIYNIGVVFRRSIKYEDTCIVGGHKLRCVVKYEDTYIVGGHKLGCVEVERMRTHI